MRGLQELRSASFHLFQCLAGFLERDALMGHDGQAETLHAGSVSDCIGVALQRLQNGRARLTGLTSPALGLRLLRTFDRSLLPNSRLLPHGELQTSK